MGSLPQFSILKGATRKYTPGCINDIIKDVALSEAANNSALIYEDGSGNIVEHTYEQLDVLSDRWSRVLSRKMKGLPPNGDGDYIVAVNVAPSDELVVALLAIWKAGAAYLPLDHAFPGVRIEHICREARPALVLYDQDSDYYTNTCKLQLDDLKAESEGEPGSSLEKSERAKSKNEDLAIVLYTSGSTGIPKGVKLQHKTILNRLNWQFKAFPFAPTEKVCVFKTSLTFVDSVCEIWGPLVKGRSLLVIPKKVTVDPEKLISLLDIYKVERMVLVPSLLRSILMYLNLKNDESILKHLKIWVCSGETLARSAVIDFFEYFADNKHVLCNFYGSTEIMGDVTYQVMRGKEDVKEWSKIPIGSPVDNTIIYLLDGEFRPVKAGEIGELFVSGLNLAAGYINGRDPDKFQNNPFAIDPTYSKMYRTGDFARLSGGLLWYEGRTDTQVKIRGHRVDLTEVERAILALDVIEKAVVLCYKPGEINQALLAFVTTHQLVTERWIESVLKKKLTAYMIPQVVLMDSIPLLVNGKIDRQSLLKYYENTNNNDDDYYPVDIDYTGVQQHQMEAATILFETVASVLSRSIRSAISIDANFYNLGGNSLNSIYTITKLNEKGYRIGITDFISALDLGEVLERMSSEQIINTEPPLFSAHVCEMSDKETCISIITQSFYRKADLEQWVLSDMSEEDYRQYLDDLWIPLVEAGLSFTIKNEHGKTVGVCINFDAILEPEIEIDSVGLSKIFEYLEYLEHDVRRVHVPNEPNFTLHCHMMGTHSCLSTKENILAIQFMEEEVFRIAKENNFKGILTVNTSPLTQQLGTDVFKYEVLLDHQVNQFVAQNNTKPFGLAPDSQRAIVQWKKVN